MPSNKITVNGNTTYEVPDSFMPPLEAYLEMVKEKCASKYNSVPSSGFNRKELQILRERAYSQSECASITCWKRALVRLGDALDVLDAMTARTEVSEAGEIRKKPA